MERWFFFCVCLFVWPKEQQQEQQQASGMVSSFELFQKPFSHVNADNRAQYVSTLADRSVMEKDGNTSPQSHTVLQYSCNTYCLSAYLFNCI